MEGIMAFLQFAQITGGSCFSITPEESRAPCFAARIETINPHSEGLDFNYSGISSSKRISDNPAMGLAGRYRIEISSEGIVAVVDSDNRLDVARSLYWHAVMNHPNRLVLLCDRDRVIARSDHQ
jgi:hypothetical protein